MKMKKFDLPLAMIGAMQYTVFYLMVGLLLSYMFDAAVTMKSLVYQNVFYYMFTAFIFIDRGIKGAHVQNQEALKRAKEQSKEND